MAFSKCLGGLLSKWSPRPRVICLPMGCQSQLRNPGHERIFASWFRDRYVKTVIFPGLVENFMKSLKQRHLPFWCIFSEGRYCVSNISFQGRVWHFSYGRHIPFFCSKVDPVDKKLQLLTNSPKSWRLFLSVGLFESLKLSSVLYRMNAKVVNTIGHLWFPFVQSKG